MSAPLADALRRLGSAARRDDRRRRARRRLPPRRAREPPRRGARRGARAARRDACARSTPRATSCASRSSCSPSAPTPSSASARTAARRPPGGRTRSSRIPPGSACAGIPGAVRIPWRQRFEQARLALCIAVGDTVTVEHEGVLSLGARRGLRQLGARQPAHRLGRPAGRAAPHRRRGALSRRHDLDRRRRRRARRGLALPGVRPHEHARRAARAPLPALHPPLAHRLRPLGRPRPPLAPAAPPPARARPRRDASSRRGARPPSATSTTVSPTPARASSR